jgi:sodium/bile acid cotransporter 7
MAKILFAGQAGGLGALVLQLMIFLQLQLVVCAVVARGYATRGAHRVVEDDREAD